MSSAPSSDTKLLQLQNIMRRLLGPDGCAWDKKQTLSSLIPFLIEESHEVIDAIETGSAMDHCEELGDLLFQIVFQSAIRESQKEFSMDDVIQSISEKLLRRHPHIFDEHCTLSAEEVEAQWETIKRAERASKGIKRRYLDGVPKGLPPLARAQRLSTKAAKVGFDWDTPEDCLKKVHEELAEIEDAAADKEHVREEIGDLLFAVVSYARKHKIDASKALRIANRKFFNRFSFIEDELRSSERSLEDATLKEMDELWNIYKAEHE